MPDSTPWALGVDVGNAKLKLFALGAGGAKRSFAAALPWSGRDPYNRETDFETGIRDGLEALLAEHKVPPACAVAVTSNGYSFATHELAARSTLKLLAAALPDTDVRALAWDGELVSDTSIGNKAGLLACTNGAGAMHLALRLEHWPGRQNGLVMDAGGTTTQLTPIVDGRIDPAALAEPARHLDHRARHGKLAWIGSRTTPLESLAQEVIVGGRVYPVIPRGVIMHEVLTLLELLPAAREKRLRLFQAAPEKALLLRAMADAIGIDPAVVSEPELLGLAREFHRLAVQRLAHAISLALDTAPKARANVLVFGLAARALALPALQQAGVEPSAITLAEDMLSPELSDLASVYGAAHAALELALGRELDAALAAKHTP